MQQLPFKTGVIPTILAISSIEHVPDDGLVFNEISRISRRDAEVIIAVPYSNNDVEVKKIVRPKFMLDALYRFKKFWKLVLGRHLNYFMEQTSTDSFMKYYNMQEINRLLESIPSPLLSIDLKKSYLYEKGLQQTFFRLLPKGWFVLKDLVFGWVLWRIEDILFKRNQNGRGIIVNARKKYDETN